MGILSEGVKLSEVERNLGVSRMCRRRLGVVMTRLRMSETVSGVGHLHLCFSFSVSQGGNAVSSI